VTIPIPALNSDRHVVTEGMNSSPLILLNFAYIENFAVVSDDGIEF
jgi:hypothetical protein